MPEITKICKTCSVSKPLFDFYKQSNRGGLGVRGSCKACDNVKKAVYAKQNRERIIANKRDDYRKNQAKHLQKKKVYRQANKGKINSLVAARKLTKIQRTPAWLSDFDKLKIKCIYSVAAMLTRHNNEPWHVDHIIPLQGEIVSGLHVPSNLRVIKGVDNISKKNKFEVLDA